MGFGFVLRKKKSQFQNVSVKIKRRPLAPPAGPAKTAILEGNLTKGELNMEVLWPRRIALLLLFLATHGAYAEMGYGSTTRLFTTPNPKGYVEFVDAINAAKESVLMTIFHITDEAVIKALIDAHKRGLDVRVITDRKTMILPNMWWHYRKLVRGGVNARKSTKGFSITHQKSMVVDHREAFITSINITYKPETTRDYAIVTNDAAIIEEMTAVFEADWENAAKHTKVTPKLTNENLLWSPVNAEPRLKAFIDSAKVEISAAIEHIGNPVLRDAMIAAAARGVRVDLIVPMCTMASLNPLHNFKFIPEHMAGKINVRIIKNPGTATHPYLHGKMMVVDKKSAYVGSINFSTNSTREARELGIIVSDATSIQGLLDTFQYDWNRAVVPMKNPKLISCGWPW